jgi:hypothetical protein
LNLLKKLSRLKTAAYLVFFIGILSSSKWKVWDGNWVEETNEDIYNEVEKAVWTEIRKIYN